MCPVGSLGAQEPAQVDVDGDGVCNERDLFVVEWALSHGHDLAAIIEASTLDNGRYDASTYFSNDALSTPHASGTASGSGGAASGELIIPPPPAFGCLFVRGDANGSTALDAADPIFLLSYLFSSGPPPPLFDAGDFDDSGILDISDPVGILGHLYGGGTQPPPPFSVPGYDLTDSELSHPACVAIAYEQALADVAAFAHATYGSSPTILRHFRSDLNGDGLLDFVFNFQEFALATGITYDAFGTPAWFGDTASTSSWVEATPELSGYGVLSCDPNTLRFHTTFADALQGQASLSVPLMYDSYQFGDSVIPTAWGAIVYHQSHSITLVDVAGSVPQTAYVQLPAGFGMPIMFFDHYGIPPLLDGSLIDDGGGVVIVSGNATGATASAVTEDPYTQDVNFHDPTVCPTVDPLTPNCCSRVIAPFNISINAGEAETQRLGASGVRFGNGSFLYGSTGVRLEGVDECLPTAAGWAQVLMRIEQYTTLLDGTASLQRANSSSGWWDFEMLSLAGALVASPQGLPFFPNANGHTASLPQMTSTQLSDLHVYDQPRHDSTTPGTYDDIDFFRNVLRFHAYQATRCPQDSTEYGATFGFLVVSDTHFIRNAQSGEWDEVDHSWWSNPTFYDCKALNVSVAHASQSASAMILSWTGGWSSWTP